MSTAAAQAHAHEAGSPATCPSCAGAISDRFCPRCGEKRFEEHDLSARHFLSHSLHELTHLDSKIFITLKLLATRPGELTVRYAGGARRHFINPVRLYLVAFALLIFLFTIYEPVSIFNMHNIVKDPSAVKAFERIAAKRHMTLEQYFERVGHTWHTYLSLSQPAQVGVMALALALFFRRAQRYIGTHLIHALHLLTFNCLVAVVLFPLRFYTGLQGASAWVLNVVTFLVETGYLFLSANRVYGEAAELGAKEQGSTGLSSWQIAARSIGVTAMLFAGLVTIYGITIIAAMVASAL